jgi:hypothetical protein
MTDQLTSIDGMSPEEIAKATRNGRLDAILSGDPFGVEAARAEVMKAKAEAEAAELATTTDEPAPTKVDQGAMGGTREPKYDEAWLATASPDEIAKATLAGHMAKLLG